MRKISKKLMGVMLALLMILCQNAVIAADSYGVFTNQGFEGEDPNVDGWFVRLGTISVDTEQYHSGSQSLKITANNANERYCRTTEVVPGRSYIFSTWVKISGELTQTGTATPTARIAIRLNENSGGAEEYAGAAVAKTTNDNWKYLIVQFTAPEGVTGVSLWLNAGAAIGNIYYDDVSFTEFDGCILNGGAEMVDTEGEPAYLWPTGWIIGNYGAAASTKGTQVYASTEHVRSGSYAVKVDDSDGSSRVTVPVSGLIASAYYEVRGFVWGAKGFRNAVLKFGSTYAQSASGFWDMKTGTQWAAEQWNEIKFVVQIPSSYTAGTGYICLDSYVVSDLTVRYWDDISVRKIETGASYCNSTGDQITSIAQGDVNVRTTLSNTGGTETKTATAIIGVYDVSGSQPTVYSIKLVSLSAAAGIYQEIITPMSIPENGTYRVKTFIWDSLAEINPVANVRTLN